MHAAIDFRVMLGRLGHAVERFDFGQDDGQRAAIAQYLEKYLGARFRQCTGHFLPHPFRHQVVHFAIVHHARHQLLGVLGDAKAQMGKTRGKARDPQYAHRIFGEVFGHMAQQAGLQILLPAVGVDQLAVGVSGDGIDG